MVSKDIYPGERDIFATHILEETEIAIGPWMTNNYDSKNGHVVIRVEPGGDQYRVFVLDDTRTDLRVNSSHGPYQSRD